MSENDNIETTKEELEAYNIVRAIVCRVAPVDRIALRDTKSYCGVLFDDNNRLPICRFYFGKNTLTVGTFDEEKKETKHTIQTLPDIYAMTDELINVTGKYMADRVKKESKEA